ncbi:hypothetical protein ACOSP7_004919 [Xanthoceras sorbifolium]
MIKRSPSRNQRSKGVKVKHVLQICVLVAVCFWLIYQVKHSHDKKKEFDMRDTKISVKEQNDDGLKLGRKDLPRAQEASKNEKHEEEEEEIAVEEENKHEEEDKEVIKHEEEDQKEASNLEEEEREEEENKNEDEEQEELNKHEEEQEEAASKHDEEEQEEAASRHEDEEQEEAASRHEDEELEAASKHEEEEPEEVTKNEEEQDEGRGGGDDEIDEQDQVKTEGDHEDELIDEENREGEGDGKASQGTESEEKDNQAENENSSVDHDHDGVEKNVHEAREEHYKGDDASSAVSHDDQIITTETEKTSSENSDENSERNILEEANKLNKTEDMNGNQNDKESKVGGSEMAENDSPLNVTTSGETRNDSRSYNPEDGLLLFASNTTTDPGAERSKNFTRLGTNITSSSLQNETQTMLASNQTQNAKVDGTTNIETTNLQTVELDHANISNTVSNSVQSDSNSTISTETVNADATTRGSFNSSLSAAAENVISSNTTADGEVNSDSSVMESIEDAQKEKSNTHNDSGGMNESQGSSTTNETVEVVKEDLVDSSDSSIVHDENDARIDLDTLPDIRTVGNSDDAAAE